MLHTRLHHAPSALLSRDVGEPCLAARHLADLDPGGFLAVPLGFQLGLSFALPRAAMDPPQLIGIIVRPLLYSRLADGTNDDVQLVSVTSNTAPVIVRPSVSPTEDVSAELALKGHEVPLVALGQVTVLPNLRFKHISQSLIY